MKKLLFIAPLLLGFVLTSCYDEDIEKINNRLDILENTAIATINQQIASIDNSILLLGKTDKELSEYIEALEADAENLNSQLNTTNTKINDVKTEISETISTEKANILAELESFRASVNSQLSAVNTTLETLKAKDAELTQQIADLNKYVASELKNTKDWTTATFATLEQYEVVTTTIATIEGQIKGLNESLVSLENRINDKIAKDIAAASATLSADIKTAIEEVTTAYTSAIADAKTEITEAYTSSLQSSISTLETSMKGWVNDKLTAYSTILETEAKIATLQGEMDGKLAAQKVYLETLVNALSANVTTDVAALRKQIENINELIAQKDQEIAELHELLDTQKDEITQAYQNAIEGAIATSEGKMSKLLADEINAINKRIDQSDVAVIEAFVVEYKGRMETAESDIAKLKSEVLQLQAITEKLLARIQSITYIPQYADGMATIDYHTKRGTLDFQISPKSVITELANVWRTALTFKAVQTQTRAVNFINLPITSFEADADNGTITIEVDGTNLGDDFFVEQTTASATLEVSDGNSCINSNYTNLTPNFIIKFEDKEVERICVVNWDTDGDLKLSYDEAAAVTTIEGVFSYRNNNGNSVYNWTSEMVMFNELRYFKSLTSIQPYAFCGCEQLLSISLPDNIESIEQCAFKDCSSMVDIVIPDNVTSIGDSAFRGCSNLSYAYIPNSVTSIGGSAFSKCLCLSNITIPDNVISIGSSAFSYCSGLTNVRLSNNINSLENSIFSDCTSLKELVIPDNVYIIKYGALQGCTNLSKVVIGSGIKTIEDAALKNSGIVNVYCKAKEAPAVYYKGTASYAPEACSIPLSSNLKIYVPRDSYDIYKSLGSCISGSTTQKNWYMYRSYLVPYDFE